MRDFFLQSTIASEWRCSLRTKRTKLIPTAGIPAIPESAMKIASEWRCAILVHSKILKDPVSLGRCEGVLHFMGRNIPQRPCHTKNTTVIVIHATTVAKRYGRVSETPYFPGEIHRKSPQIVNYYGDSQLLRHIIFSTAGSFGLKGDKESECKRSNGRSRNYREINCFFLQEMSGREVTG